MAFTVRLKLLGDTKRKRSKEVVSSHEAKQARGNRESSVSKVSRLCDGRPTNRCVFPDSDKGSSLIHPPHIQEEPAFFPQR